jgi:small-conductance mechanosensitive channel
MTAQWEWTGDLLGRGYARPVAAFLLTLLVLLVARRLILRALYKRARRENGLLFIALETLRVPSILWCLAAAMKFGLDLSFIPAVYAAEASRVIAAFLIISVSIGIASLSARALAIHGRRSGTALALSGLPRTLLQVFVFTLGASAVLALYNVNIAAILGALGIGGLAVALALQDTLANFFAGIHILVEEPISLGSSIRLSSGEEGVVTDIGWRTTRLRSGANNIVVIPNTKITTGILINYTLPDTRVAADISIIVGFDADLERVRRIALEEARGADGVLANPEPVVLFNPGALPTHLQFTLVFHVPDVARRPGVQSEIRLRIYNRLRAERVPLPPLPLDAKVI